MEVLYSTHFHSMFQRQGIWFWVINLDAEMWAMKSMLLDALSTLALFTPFGINFIYTIYVNKRGLTKVLGIECNCLSNLAYPPSSPFE